MRGLLFAGLLLAVLAGGAQADTLYSQNFEGLTTGATVPDWNGTFKCRTGVATDGMVGKYGSCETTVSLAYTPGLGWTNYSWTTNAHINSSTTGWLLFRYTPTVGGYGLKISNSSPYFSLYRFTGNYPSAPLLLGSWAGGGPGNSGINITCIGSAIDVTIDGVIRIQAVDNLYSTGTIGLYSAAPYEFTLDNCSVGSTPPPTPTPTCEPGQLRVFDYNPSAVVTTQRPYGMNPNLSLMWVYRESVGNTVAVWAFDRYASTVQYDPGVHVDYSGDTLSVMRGLEAGGHAPLDLVYVYPVPLRIKAHPNDGNGWPEIYWQQGSEELMGAALSSYMPPDRGTVILQARMDPVPVPTADYYYNLPITLGTCNTLNFGIVAGVCNNSNQGINAVFTYGNQYQGAYFRQELYGGGWFNVVWRHGNGKLTQYWNGVKNRNILACDDLQNMGQIVAAGIPRTNGQWWRGGIQTIMFFPEELSEGDSQALANYTMAGEWCSPTVTPSISPTPVDTFTVTATPTPTAIDTYTATETPTPSCTETETLTESPTWTGTPTATETITVTSSETPTETETPTATPTVTETSTWTATATPTVTSSATEIPTTPPTATATPIMGRHIHGTINFDFWDTLECVQ